MRYELREDPNEECAQDLWRIDEDGTETYLGTDAMAPEDMSFWRALSWVPDELNRLATLLQQQREFHFDVALQLEKYANTVAAHFPGVKNKLLKQGRRLRGGGLTEQP